MARLSRSQTDKYLVCLNLFSNTTNCSYVNAVRRRRRLFDNLSELVDDDFDAFKLSSILDEQTSKTRKNNSF